MPDRVVRDELLTDARYWSVSAEARCLFMGIWLSADDAARMSGALFGLRTRCMAGTVNDATVLRLLAELVDADLVRQYMVEGQPYLFVPRFRQRQRYVKSSRHPEPPPAINDLAYKKTDSSAPEPDLFTTPAGPKTRGVGVGVDVGVQTRPLSPAVPGSTKEPVDKSTSSGQAGDKSKASAEKINLEERLAKANIIPGAFIQDEKGKYWATKEDLFLARRIFEHLKAAAPAAKPKPPKFHIWADELRQMREAGRSTADASLLLEVAAANPKWRRRILSPAQLNRHWHELVALANSAPGWAATREGVLKMADAHGVVWADGESMQSVIGRINAAIESTPAAH